MFKLTIKSMRANKARFLLTSVAVLLGVAFMAGTFVLTDTIQKSYDDIASNVYRNTDAVVRSARSIESTDQKGATTRGTISAATLDTVRAVPGVQAAEPQQQGIAVVVGHDGRLLDSNPNRATPLAMAWQDTPAFNPLTIVAGNAPRAPDEIVVDQRSVDTGHFQLGETVQVVTPVGSSPFRIAGIATYGGTDDAAGAQVVAFTPETASQVIGTPGRFDAIQVLAAPGVSQSTLVGNLRTALQAPQTEVITGTQAATEARDASAAGLAFVSMFLLTCAIVALVVGSFVIYNTFSITVAQRTKEIAMLRAIGAKRRQVMRSVRIEAIVTGVVASAAGVVAGVFLAQGLRAMLSAFGMNLPSGDVVVEPRTIAISMVTGVVVTVLAVWLPARRAAKVAPIEALRGSAIERAQYSKRRVVLGVLTTAAGAFFMAQGLSGDGAAVVGGGAFLVFFGVTLVGPAIARRFMRVVGWPLRLRGMPGTLARQNAMRSPRRTSATASALMIGLGLVAFMTVFAASAKASISTSIDRAMKSDFIVATQFGMGGLSPTAAQRIDDLPETGAVTSIRLFEAKVGGVTSEASAVDPAKAQDSVEFDLQAGDVKALGAHEVAVRAERADQDNVHLGDTVTMFFPETGDQQLTVVALYGTKEPLGDYVVSQQVYDANIATHVDDYVVVSNAPGVSSAATRQAVENVLADFPTAKLMSEAEFKGAMADKIDAILNLVYVLLAMAVVIALFGVTNTLALSVFERTHELGLLRAVGMTRSQLRATVRWESVLIALLGTTLGTGIGVAFGWALARSLESQGFNTFAVPVPQLAVIVLFAAVAAVGAAALPARRAAKLDVLEAISTN